MRDPRAKVFRSVTSYRLWNVLLFFDFGDIFPFILKESDENYANMAELSLEMVKD